MKNRIVWLTAVLLIGFMGVSPSRAQEVVNLLTNGGFENGVLWPWNIYDNTGTGATGEVVTELLGAVVPEDPIEGIYCLHLEVDEGREHFWDAGLQYMGLVFKEGKKYTLSAFLKCKEGTLDINFKPELAQSPWTGYAEQIITMTDEWAEYSVTTPVFEKDVIPAEITFHIAFTPGDFWIDGVRFYEVLQVEIDIKPGSDPNPINQGSNGLVPVAILSSDVFDATQVEPTTVSLAGASVAVRGKGKSMAHEEDVNGDGLVDLVVQVETQGFDDLGVGGTVELTGTTFSGEAIVGYDEVVIVPPDK